MIVIRFFLPKVSRFKLHKNNKTNVSLIKNAINQFPEPKTIGLDTLFIFIALSVWKICQLLE